ncbi:YlmH/Sll1252 family protein [Thermoanaerobacterium saccharolyticum]|uniref:YlmH family RNA-binding protein n=1 Tax=Thermoanaerobacterium saccharolyticum TaxID=28896 RepID=UPI0005EF67DC
MEYSTARLSDIINWVQKNRRDRFTDFLSMKDQKILLKLIAKHDDIDCRFDGGFKEAERKIACIYPSFLPIYDGEHFNVIKGIRINGDLIKLSHRDVLGSLLGLGIKREKIGDIIKRQEICDVIVHNDIADYVLMTLKKIGREKVIVSSIGLDEVIEPTIEYEDIKTTVASIRLDSIIASGFKISRTKASEMIKAGLTEVNWETNMSPSFEVKEEDIMSLRGYGRIKLQEVLGTSRKGRVYVHILKYK